MRPRRPQFAALRSFWWARNALRRARSELKRGELSGITLAPPPRLPANGVKGVDLLLRLRDHTCLEGALVTQRWLAANGVRRDVVIGVGAPSEGFVAHAWLEGTEDVADRQFVPLRRLAP